MYQRFEVGADGLLVGELAVGEEERQMDDLVETGRWLVEHRASLDRGEAEWLERLAEFDREGLWQLDGHLCCATWLVWRTNMARSTAFEKLRVAHELSRRPLVAGAFRQGRLSYSAARAITRMDRPDPEVDEALVELATSGQASILDIERVVRSYMLYADQERRPADDPDPARDVRIRRGDQGVGQIVITSSDIEIEQFAAALQAFIDLRYRSRPVDESPTGDCPAVSTDPDLGPVDESTGGDPESPTSRGEAPLEAAGPAATRADAFTDLVNAALAAADDGQAVGDDRYLVHLVRRYGDPGLSLLSGGPLDPADAATISCDHSRVTHIVADGGEPLALGRKTRQWSTAQRRAISVRDGGHCRFPGCQYSHYDIHHLHEWQTGGPTDTNNGICECRRHHRMVHAGYQVHGDPNDELRFYRPDGTYIGSTYPAARWTATTTPAGSRRNVP